MFSLRLLLAKLGKSFVDHCGLIWKIFKASSTKAFGQELCHEKTYPGRFGTNKNLTQIVQSQSNQSPCYYQEFICLLGSLWVLIRLWCCIAWADCSEAHLSWNKFSCHRLILSWTFGHTTLPSNKKLFVDLPDSCCLKEMSNMDRKLDFKRLEN